MDGWMDVWIDGCVDGCVDAWMDGCVDGWMERRLDELVPGASGHSISKPLPTYHLRLQISVRLEHPFLCPAISSHSSLITRTDIHHG